MTGRVAAPAGAGSPVTGSLPRQLVVASRGSRLALRQADLVASLVRSVHPEVAIEIKTVKTTGDRDRRPFRVIEGKGLFTNEVEREVIEGRADVAVHSAKDMTAELAPGCSLVCIPARASVHDVLVFDDEWAHSHLYGDSRPTRPASEEGIGALPAGARVGTSSIRRRALLAEARPELELVDLRGNLDTRLAKVARGEVEGALLAAAGLERLGLADPASQVPLDPTWWVPAPAQGALAVEALDMRTEVAALFSGLGDPSTTAEVRAERAFGARLEGGCSVPLGCLARASSDRLVVTGYVGAPDGSHAIRDRVSGPLHSAEALGAELAEAILDAGGADILADLRAEREADGDAT